MKTQELETAVESVYRNVSGDLSSEVRSAALEYIKRKRRLSHPNGEFDGGQRFYLASQERRACCEGIRRPSRSYPYSEMAHGRSLRHVAELFDIDERDVRRLVQLVESEMSATA
ncbi:hypothetical protein [Ruegeria sp. HKCCSP346]|uniref:hypothetical protein n=1 Tax=Ruegeria sp. HKCCSP346 TaxID=2794830 RepID=UPI001AE3C4F2|nr:hypothetical protein [Ruegeria sp. HKCCSP346]